MISKWTIVYACALLAFCEAAFVETLQKCAVEDSSCLQDLIQSVMKTKSPDGIKEYNIEPFDPIQLRNIKIAILGILNINLDEGEARGVKDCVIDNIVTDAKEGRLVLEATCDLIINAKFKLEEVSPLIQKSFASNSIEGSGRAKVILDKLHMKFAFLFDYLKKEDGEIYYKIKPEKTVYEYKVGKAKFIAENILLGGQDIGKEVNQFMDENLGFLLKSFGKNFFDVAMDILNNILVKFFDNTPTKYFLSTDLTPYLKTV